MKRTGLATISVALAVLSAGVAIAQQAVQVPTVEVIGATPILGANVDRNKVPGNVQVLNPADAVVPPDGIADLLVTRLPSVTINDAQNNPYQPDLNFRGFTASPLLGNAQGIAVYQNGVRINETFGDTVNWDLIPEMAVNRLNMVPSGWNAVHGLNALGGALVLDMKNGFEFTGTEVEGEIGSFGKRRAALQHGGSRGANAFYFAVDGLNEDGWRDFSPSPLRRLFADYSWRGDDLDLSLNFTGAQNTLVGNGAAPIELLAARRESIFTAPDETQNTMAMLSFNGDYIVNDAWSVQFAANMRRVLRATLNGDASEFEECAGTNVGETDAATLAPFDPDDFMCEDAGEADEEILLDENGARISASAAREGGVLNTTNTQTTTYGLGLQATWNGRVAGRDHVVIGGISRDAGNTKFHSETELGALDDNRFAQGDDVLVQETLVRALSDTTYTSLFVVDTISLTQRLGLNLAARYNRAQISIQDEIGDDLNGDHTFNRLNPSAGLTYAYRPNAALSLSYSETNRAPTAAELTCADPDDPCRFPNAFVADPPLAQVVAKTFEVGARGVRGNVEWNGAIFRTTSHQDIVFISSGPGTQSGYFQNVGETRRQGLEFAARAKVGRWTPFFNYTFLDATFQSPFTINSPNNPFADDDEIFVEAGDRIPLTPRHNWRIGTDFDVTSNWIVGGVLLGTSSQYYRGDEANLSDQVAGYHTVDLHTKYKIGRAVDLFARIDNVFDNEYETFGIFGEVDEVDLAEAPGAENPRMLGAGKPRSFSLGLKIRF